MCSAARLVKVTPRVSSGGMPAAITAARRSAMRRVLPVPAGANTSKVPWRWSMTCCLLGVGIGHAIGGMVGLLRGPGKVKGKMGQTNGYQTE